MAKPKTQVFEAYAKIKFVVRITPKKMFVDMVTSNGDKKVYCYIERVSRSYTCGEPQYSYVASKPNSRWCKHADTIEAVVKHIEDDLDMVIPEEAVDVFTARIMSEVFK